MYMSKEKIRFLDDVAKCSSSGPASHDGMVYLNIDNGNAIATNGKILFKGPIPNDDHIGQSEPFPNVDKCLKGILAKKPESVVKVNASFLIKALLAISHFEDEYGDPSVWMETRGDGEPIVFKAEAEGGQEAIAVVCTITTQELKASSPCQTRQAPKRQLQWC